MTRNGGVAPANTEPVPAGRVREAFAAHPESVVLVFPRGPDGRYPQEATDVVSVLHESGVAVDYATDPMAAGTYTYKSVELMLPAIVIALGAAGDVVTIANGVVDLVHYYLGRRPKARVEIDVGVKRGNDVRWVKIDVSGSPDHAERLTRDVLDRVLGD
jgi:hypothetical protein